VQKTASDELFSMQVEQLRHDELYHKDIVRLPLGDRMKHMALHMSKYGAHLITAAKSDDTALFRHTLVDALIITLASANALNVHIGDNIGASSTPTTSLLGVRLSNELGRQGDDPYWTAHHFVIASGNFAKACESLDHVEGFPFREGMRDAVLTLAKLTLAEAAVRQINIESCVHDRLRQVEEKSIFDVEFERQRALNVQ
jgi:hypothetical protein